jgi:type II secretory pathway component PulF
VPVYQYRAVDENGILIKNKVQEKSKQNLIKRLKANGLIPIDVTQTSFGKYQKVNKVNTNMQELMKMKGKK